MFEYECDCQAGLHRKKLGRKLKSENVIFRCGFCGKKLYGALRRWCGNPKMDSLKKTWVPPKQKHKGEQDGLRSK